MAASPPWVSAYQISFINEYTPVTNFNTQNAFKVLG